jgi:hypothetical protein
MPSQEEGGGGLGLEPVGGEHAAAPRSKTMRKRNGGHPGRIEASCPLTTV